MAVGSEHRDVEGVRTERLMKIREVLVGSEDMPGERWYCVTLCRRQLATLDDGVHGRRAVRVCGFLTRRPTLSKERKSKRGLLFACFFFWWRGTGFTSLFWSSSEVCSFRRLLLPVIVQVGSFSIEGDGGRVTRNSEGACPYLNGHVCADIHTHHG